MRNLLRTSLLFHPPRLSEFSQSQSILRTAENIQNDSVCDVVVVSGAADVVVTSVVHAVGDVDSMDPSLASLKQRIRLRILVDVGAARLVYLCIYIL